VSELETKEKKDVDIKTELRRLVAGNRLERATEKLLAATAGEEYGDFRSKVVHQSGQLNEYLDLQIHNTEDYDTITRNRNKISLGLLNLINDLPDAAALAAAKQAPTGVSEHKLKKRLFWALLLGKIVVLFYAFFLVDTGSGLTSKDFLTVVGILIPMFGAYLAIILQDDTKNRRILKPEDIRVTSDFARKAYLVVGVYPFILCLLLYLRATGTITSMVALTLALGFAESGWGAYVGKVIFGLFRGE
jgi:hypothetical protein